MCTVTFIARRGGYALGMNRDEKRTRAVASPPAHYRLNGCQALFPTEPTGGTWIGVNETGITLALVNWYSVKTPIPEKALSRGEIVRSMLSRASSLAVHAALMGFPLDRVSPFRLIGVFPEQGQVLEWRWNLKRLERLTHPWRTTIWISSGFDEPGAQRTRSQIFRKRLRQSSAGQRNWLTRLHRSHLPERGPYSTCMHRSDAATVSFTEITISRRKASMRYTPGPPCCTDALPAIDLPIQRR